MFNYLNMLAAG